MASLDLDHPVPLAIVASPGKIVIRPDET